MDDTIFLLAFCGVIAGIAILVTVISLVCIDKRYHKNHGTKIPFGYIRTEEVTIDPKNNKRFRVYYDEKNGERFYHEEELE